MIRKRSRRAYTLIELSVVVSVSSALMVVAAGWIHQSMKFGAIVRSRQNTHHILLRLVSQLRDDVQRGKSMVMQGNNELVILASDSVKTTYTISPERITKIVTDGEQVASQEMFPLVSTSEPSWDATELPSTISLTIVRGSGTPIAAGFKSDSRPSSRAVDLHVRVSADRFAGSREATP